MSPIPHLVAPSATFRTPIPDPNNPRAGDWVRAWDGHEDLSQIDLAIIGAPLSRASLSHSGAYLLPSAIRQTLLDFSTYDSERDVDLAPLRVRDIGDIALDLLDVRASHEHIRTALHALDALAPLVMTLGGDHSITKPALVARAAVAGMPIGLVQFDAHHDVRVLDGGPNNGTPIRGAIEAGAIRGEDVAQIGIHAFANSVVYADWAREAGIGIHTMPAVRRRGILPVLADALAQARQAPGGVYVTVDMDVLDRSQAPGCPASGPGGLMIWDLADALYVLGQQPDLVGIDFVEVDPQRDVANMTVKATCLAILSFCAGRLRATERGGSGAN